MPSVSTQTPPHIATSPESATTEPQITVTASAKEFGALLDMAEETYDHWQVHGADEHDNETRNLAGPLWVRIQTTLEALDEPKSWKRCLTASASPEGG